MTRNSTSTDPAMMCVKPPTPTSQVTPMMTPTRADSANGSSQTIKAISQPAKMPRSSARPNVTPADSRAMS